MRENLFMFEALLYPSTNGFEVWVEDLDLRTQGDDLQEAVYMAQDVIQTVVSYLVENGESVPEPTFGRKAPDGGYSVVIATNAPEPETSEMIVRDAADILGVSDQRIYALCREGKLESHKVGSTVLVTTKSVKRRLAEDVRPGRPRKQAYA